MDVEMYHLNLNLAFNQAAADETTKQSALLLHELRAAFRRRRLKLHHLIHEQST